MLSSILGSSGKREFLKSRPRSIFAFMHEVIESNLATKRDIQELKTEFKRDIRELEQRMIIKLGGLIVITLGILVALSNINII